MKTLCYGIDVRPSEMRAMLDGASNGIALVNDTIPVILSTNHYIEEGVSYVGIPLEAKKYLGAVLSELERHLGRKPSVVSEMVLG